MKTLLKNAHDSIFVWNNKAKSYNKTCDVWIVAPTSASNGVYTPIGFNTPLQALHIGEDRYVEPSTPTLGLAELALPHVKLDVFAFIGQAVEAKPKYGRYYLAGIAINDGAMVATDGHRLHYHNLSDVFKVKEGGYTIPAHAVAMIIAACKELKLTDFSLDFGLECGCAYVGFYKIFFKYIDGKYPEWRKVLPQGESSQPAAISPSIMQEIKDLRIKAKQARELAKGVKIPLLDTLFIADYIEPLLKYGACVGQIKDATSPALFTFDNGVKAIVMPTR